MSENKKHKGNYKGTGSMHAENQNMEFVNDTLEKNAKATKGKSDNLKGKL